MNVRCVSVADIAKKIDGVVWGDENEIINEFCLPRDSQITSLTYFESTGSLFENKHTQFAACIVPIGYKYCDERTYIIVKKDVNQILHTIVDYLIEKGVYQIQQKSSMTGRNIIISESAKIGELCNIGNNVVIEDNVIIGDRCRIGSNVVIEHDVWVGNDVEIQSGVVIGADSFEYANSSGYKKISNIGSVIINDNVTIGANCTIARGTIGNTIIGDGTKIDTLVQIGHEVLIGKNCRICSQCGVAGWALIEDNVTLYGKVGVGNHVIIEKGATVLAMSGVTKRIKAYSVVSGNPAIDNRDYLKEKVVLRELRKRS